MAIDVNQYTIKPITTVDEMIIAGYIRSQAWKEAYSEIVSPEALAYRTPEYCARKMRYLINTSSITAEAKGILALDKENNDAVGFIIYGLCRDSDKNPNETGELYALYTLEKTYGSGLGHTLLTYAEQDLMYFSNNIGEITLWVLERNNRAKSFYEKEGYSLDGISKELPNLGKDVVEIRMSKRIDEESWETPLSIESGASLSIQ